MLRYIIASHGKLGEGFLNALGILFGQTEKIDTISAYVDGEQLEDKVASVFEKYDINDTIVVFTDILGGSVNQYFSRLLLQNKNIHVISGVNLVLILEIIMRMDSEFDKVLVLNAIEQSKEQMCYVNDRIMEDDSDSTATG